MAITYDGGSFGENLVEVGDPTSGMEWNVAQTDAANQPAFDQMDENRNTEVDIAGEYNEKLKHFFGSSVQNFVKPRVDRWIDGANKRYSDAERKHNEKSGDQAKKDFDDYNEELKKNAGNYGDKQPKKPEKPQPTVAGLTAIENGVIAKSKDGAIIQEKITKQSGNPFIATQQFQGLDAWSRDAGQIKFIQENVAGYEESLNQVPGIMGYTDEGKYNYAVNVHRRSKLAPIMAAYDAAGMKPRDDFLQKYFYDPINIFEQAHKTKWKATATKNIQATAKTTEKQQYESRLINTVAKSPSNNPKETQQLTANAKVREVVNRVSYLAGKFHLGDMGAAWNQTFEDLNSLAARGGLNRDLMNALKVGEFIGADGGTHTLPSKYGAKFAELEATYNKWVKHDNQVAAANKTKAQRDFFTNYKANMPTGQGQKAVDDYMLEQHNIWKNDVELGNGKDHPKIKYDIDNLSLSGQHVNKYMEQAKALAEVDALTEAWIDRSEVPQKVKDDYRQLSQEQDEARKLNPYDVDDFTKLAAGLLDQRWVDHASNRQVGMVLYGRYQEMQKDKHLRNVDGEDKLAAYQEAYDEIYEWWDKNANNYKATIGYDYKKLQGAAKVTTGLFGNRGILPSSKADREEITILTARLHDLKGKALTTTEERKNDDLLDTALFTYEEIAQMKKGYGEKGFTIDPKLYWVSEYLRDEDGNKVHPLAILNQLSETTKQGSLGTTDSEILFNSLNPVAQYDAMNNSQNSQEVKARIYYGTDVNGRLVASEKKLKEGSPELVKFKESLLSEDVSKEVDNIVQENDLPKDNTFTSIYRMMAEGVDITGIEIPFSDSWRELQLYKLEMTEDPKEYESTLQQLIDPALTQYA